MTIAYLKESETLSTEGKFYLKVADTESTLTNPKVNKQNTHTKIMFQVRLTGLTIEQLSCLVFLRLICMHWLPLSEMHMHFFSQYFKAGAVISPGTEQALHSCCPPTVFANHSLVIMPCFRTGQTGRPLSRKGNVTC